MREIKFKCWDSILKYWLNEEDMPIVNGDGKGMFHEFGGNENYKFCRFTGLRDKNGAEIFESDIVEFKHHEFTGNGPQRTHMGEVIYSDVYPTLLCHWELPMFLINSYYGEWGKSDFFGTRFEQCQYIEIIGNKFEHPELLT